MEMMKKWTDFAETDNFVTRRTSIDTVHPIKT